MIPACRAGERVATLRSMRAIFKKSVLAGALALGVMLPSAASAVTLEEVVSLARAGVTDAIILALIDRDKTVFAIEPDQILKLQRDGLTEPVILALLKSGREEGDQAARADAASSAAWIMASMPTEPLLTIVGHGPERPNVAHPDGFYSGPPAYGPFFGASRRHYGPRSFGGARYDVPRQMCIAQINTARSTKALSYMTECPDVMQPRRLR
jgi:hypothetical protein